ncbi:GNAT family N-acetyltransferase [Streptomyces palmae]|uniref:GNAT family N-acetyltransferase n=1 Tax=Streptomyces palmae TaxID=1701085 RepID=A0A4Z0G5A6_9ACTN|nr:GNAT family N-acetyltransferase [Streptomyces palmae]TGA89140.1 GNAT family N-acetyltransferase [Streptomyces palmae]
MTLTFVRDPELTPALEEEIVRLWTDATNGGGAVGLVPPVTAEDVRPLAEGQAAGVRAGTQRLLAAYEGGALAGVAYLKRNLDPLCEHWATVVCVMVRPELQGGGRGARLVREIVKMGRELGFRGLRLSARGGHGLEHFYARAGFKEVGRMPEGVHAGGGDYRDEIMMWLQLA